MFKNLIIVTLTYNFINNFIIKDWKRKINNINI